MDHLHADVLAGISRLENRTWINLLWIKTSLNETSLNIKIYFRMLFIRVFRDLYNLYLSMKQKFEQSENRGRKDILYVEHIVFNTDWMCTCSMLSKHFKTLGFAGFLLFTRTYNIFTQVLFSVDCVSSWQIFYLSINEKKITICTLLIKIKNC